MTSLLELAAPAAPVAPRDAVQVGMYDDTRFDAPPPFTAFRVDGLDPGPFASLFDLSDETLAAQGMQRVIADADRGFPCRVSLEDAHTGDELILLPFEHQPAASPYRASGPIFVRRGAPQARLAPGALPPCVTGRTMSVRGYDASHCIVDAEVCEGDVLRDTIARLFSNDEVAYLQVHNARRGCFACEVRRA
jgi:hypothetical protein